MAVNPMVYSPTTVEESTNVIMLNSPFYQNLTSVSPFTHIRLKLWVWTGDLYSPFDNEDEPNVILYEEKVSASDTHILFEISNYVKDLFNPVFQYSNTGLPIVDNTVVFFKYEYDIINNPTNSNTITISSVVSSPTYLGTQGWLWDYESSVNSWNENNGAFGFYQANLPVKNFNPRIKYTTFEYNLWSDNTADCFDVSIYNPSLEQQVCPKEGWLLVYINKEGRWDYFTPTGKSSVSQKIEREQYTKTYRNPQNFVNSRDHQVKQYNTGSETTIILNTGLVTEAQGQYVEEILYSPVVYLLEFKPTLNLSGFYNNWITRPVIVTDSDFARKTRLNDKGKISYNVKFETTTNKIKNIR